jgi:hypothetical protein
VRPNIESASKQETFKHEALDEGCKDGTKQPLEDMGKENEIWR